ncbi:MAG: hypothetical protein DRI79_13335 [Chloroflexi bacterium]|nr:MAG: hypothetical protein DRI79_13335 [Chloroflexota bacterium]
MPQVTNVNALQAFADILPNPRDLEPQPREFWNWLRVWHERVLSERLRDADLVRRRLESVGKGLLQALCLWIGMSIDAATTADLLEALQDAIATDPSQTWCQDLFLLMELLQGRSHEAIHTIGRVLLPEPIIALIDSDAFTPNGRRLAYAMQAYYQNPANLTVLVLFEHAERVGYTRYALVPRAEEGDHAIREDEAEYAAQRIQEGEDLSALTVPVVDQALQTFETRHGGRKRSTCARILQESGDSTLVFIYRVLREANIPEMDRTLFGDEVETIVLRFRDRLRSLEERSTKHIGVSIASAIASHLLEAKVEYIDDTSRTTRQAVDGLLDSLLKREDDQLRLVGICLHQSPLEGSPVLLVRCDKSKSLAPTVEFLEEKEISLLEELEDVEYISLAFDRIVGERRRPYIFKLRFEPIAGSYFVRYSCGRLSRYLRNQFEHYLREKYDVRAIPTTG